MISKQTSFNERHLLSHFVYHDNKVVESTQNPSIVIISLSFNRHSNLISVNITPQLFLKIALSNYPSQSA